METYQQTNKHINIKPFSTKKMNWYLGSYTMDKKLWSIVTDTWRAVN